LKQQELTY